MGNYLINMKKVFSRKEGIYMDCINDSCVGQWDGNCLSNLEGTSTKQYLGNEALWEYRRSDGEMNIVYYHLRQAKGILNERSTGV